MLNKKNEVCGASVAYICERYHSPPCVHARARRHTPDPGKLFPTTPPLPLPIDISKIKLQILQEKARGARHQLPVFAAAAVNGAARLIYDGPARHLHTQISPARAHACPASEPLCGL